MGEISQNCGGCRSGEGVPRFMDGREGCGGDRKTEVEKLVEDEGVTVSNAFVIWQGEEQSRKPGLVCNFKEMRQRWRKGSVKMETLEHFAMDLKRGDHVINFEIKSG
jgi:hypothetical protein